jgi:CheY-like chemotaxis protein
VRVVLAEDLALLRDGLIRLLEANGFDVVEAVDNGPSLLRALTTHRPDVAVVDVRLPPSFTDEGLRAAIEARRQVPGLPVLVLSQYVEQLYVGYCEVRDLVGELRRDRPQWTQRQLHDALLGAGSPPARHLRTLLS